MEKQFTCRERRKFDNIYVRKNFKETAKWTKFLAILGFVGIGLMVLGSLVMLFVPSSLMSNEIFLLVEKYL